MEKSFTSSPETNLEPSSGVNAHSKFYIPSLDGMRIIAFLIVFLSHTGLAKAFPGSFGVTVFFFLSGYLITTLLRQEYDRYETISLYLVHYSVLFCVWKNMPQLNKVVQAGISLLISFGLAYLIYQFIELPFGQLRKKFSRA